MANKFKVKRGTNLSNITTAPEAGELIYKSDTKQLFVGDGSTAASALTPIGGASTSGSNNQILTDDGSGGITSEGNLTFSSLTLQIPSASGKVSVDTLLGYSNNTNKLLFNDDQDSANNQVSLQSINHINVMTDGNNNGTGNFKVWNGSYDVDTADLAFQIGATSNATFYGNVTISQGGDLNVDNNTLFVDGSANNVGIGTNSPDRRLTVTGGAIVTAKFASTSGTGHLVDMISDNATDGYNGFRFYEQTNHRMSLSHIQTGTRGYMQIGNSWASGSEILVVDGDNSRVGIGTASPSVKLDVAGDIALKNNATYLYFKDASGTSFRGMGINSINNFYVGPIDSFAGGFMLYGASANTSGHVWYSGNAEAMRIDSSQKVGIGTNSPDELLDVNGVGKVRGGSSEGLILELGQLSYNATVPAIKVNYWDDTSGGTSGLTSGDHFEFYNPRYGFRHTWARGGAGGAVPIATLQNNSSNGVFELFKALNPTVDATYQSNVKLNVNGDSFFRGGAVTIGDVSPLTTGGTPRLSLRGAGFNIGNGTNDMSYIRSTVAGEYQWQTWNGANDGELQLQPYGGKVGIGNTTPAALLDVGGDADEFALIGRARVGFNSHSDYASFQHRDSATSTGYALLQHSNGTTYLNSTGNMHFRVGNVDKMKMDSSGNLGIGNVAPQAPLHVGTGNTARHIKVSDSRAMFGYDGSNAVVQGGNTKGIKFNTGTDTFGSNTRVVISSSGDTTFNGAVKLQSELDFIGNGNKIIDVETLEGSNSFRIRHHNPVGNLFEDAIRFNANGGALIYYNGSNKIETTNTGATVTGALSVSGALSFGSLSGEISTSSNINTDSAYKMDGTIIIDSSKIPINIADPHGTDRAGSVLVTDYAGVTSPTADGWYTIAKGTVHDARGGGIIGIGFTGGYASPKTFTCDFQVGWGGELHRCNISNETDVIVKVRLITTSSTTELQAYFNISSGLSDNPQTMRVTFTRDKYNPYWSIEDPLTQVASPLETREETNVNGRGVKFYSSDTNTFEINNSHFVFNELSKDVNFRVESNGDANMLFVDGGTNRVGIGTGSPDSELHVSNNTANLKIESTGSGNASYLHIKNTTNQYDIFNNAGNLQIDVNGVATRFKIHSDGLVRSNSNHVFGAENTNSKAYIRANNGYSTAATPDYTFWYNDTCGIFHPAANTIGFSVGNNEMGRFTNTGFGIGTTSPSHKVHIASNSSTNSVLRIDGDDARGGNRYALDVQDDDANRRGVARFRHTTGSGNPPILIAEGYDHAYIFQSKNTSASDAEQFRIEHYDGNVYIDSRRGNLGLYATGGSVVVPSQNVGIGTSSPGYKLDVAGDARSDRLIFRTNASAPTADAAVYRAADNTFAVSTNNTERMRINSSGNLGIGTNSPSAKLEVNGTSNFTGEMYIDHGGSDYAPGINFMGGTNTPGSNTYENCKLAYYDNSGTGFMRYTIGRSAGTHSFRIGGNEVFYVDAAGQGRFRGSSDINMVVESTDSGGGIAIKDSNTSGDYYNGIFVDGNELFFKANNSERMRIDSSGKVAIAHNDPDALLHINPGNALCNVKLERQGVVAWRFGIDTNNANLKFDAGDDALGGPEFLITTNGAGHFDNDVIAFSNSTGSDKRLKKNIKPIPYGLKEVLQMNPVEYDWKEKRDESHDIGVIAQEIEEIIPEVVKEHEDLKTQKEFKTVDYGKMVAVLIKAVQEQQQQINELKEKLNG